MSDTPETDAAKCKFTSLFGDDEDAYWVPLKLARRLERDRDEQCRLLGMSAEREGGLRGKIERERALADRLGKMLELYYENDDIAHHAGIANSLTAWKEARSE